MIKDVFDFVKYANKLEYRYTKTHGKAHPHEYCYAKNNDELKIIRELNKYIQEHGEKEMFYTTEFDVLFVDGFKYWSVGQWKITKILNRNWDFKNEDGTINKSKTEERLQN